MTADAEAWIELLLKRGPELRRAGVLSLGCEGFSAVLAPAGPELDEPATAKGKESTGVDLEDDPVNPWENPSSYPTGIVPTLEAEKDLPDIPQFGDR